VVFLDTKREAQARRPKIKLQKIMKVSPMPAQQTTYNHEYLALLQARLTAGFIFLLFAMFCTMALAQFQIEEAPISYGKTQVDDPISRLQKRLDKGEAKLTFDKKHGHGYLPSVLKELKVPTSSQMLVFSKTSFQRSRITPRTPRALYFSDDMYIGWVQKGDVVEITAVDPQQGAVFYSLDQKETAKPKFVRQTDRCTLCHASSQTKGVPGHLVRSVYPGPTGMPYYSAGTFRTNHESPFKNRWGGWYVSGTHGKQRHMGNVTAKDKSDPEQLDVEAGANVTDLSKLINTAPYLTPHSDIVSLMVLEHQGDMHNFITLANYQARLALRDEQIMNQLLENPERRSDSTIRRLNNASERLVKYMLFVDEAKLTAPVQGSSSFAKDFSALGPRDGKGRSLRDFDLKTRLFKYPCSYQIYSEAFVALPDPVKNRIYRRLREILTGQDKSKEFAHLSPQDRQAIFEILRDTVPDFRKAEVGKNRG